MFGPAAERAAEFSRPIYRPEDRSAPPAGGERLNEKVLTLGQERAGIDMAGSQQHERLRPEVSEKPNYRRRDFRLASAHHREYPFFGRRSSKRPKVGSVLDALLGGLG